jgi:flagellar basal-body rod protein FlgF
MPGGAYSALSGMQQRLEALDRVASDLANVSTSGYKSERAANYAAEREQFSDLLDSAVDVAKGGAKIDFRPGTITTTGRDLDVAIEGRGMFVIETANGERYTRGGSFSRRADGVLVTADGDPVMGVGAPGKNVRITLPKGAVTVGADGSLRVGEASVGQLKVVEFDEKDLMRESGSRFRVDASITPKDSESSLVAGALEQANVSAVDRMVALTEITRSFEALQKGISVLMNDIDGRAIAELGKR